MVHSIIIIKCHIEISRFEFVTGVSRSAMLRRRLTYSLPMWKWGFMFRHTIFLCFLLCLPTVRGFVPRVHTYDRVAGTSVREGALPCETSTDCARGELCIALVPLARSAMFGVCDQSARTRRFLARLVGRAGVSRISMNRSMCRCVTPPSECSSSTQCSAGYRCVRSAFLAGRTMCLHCNYEATISESSSAGADVVRSKKLTRASTTREDEGEGESESGAESDFDLSEDEVRAGLVPVDSIEVQCTPSASPWVTPKPRMLRMTTTVGYTWDPCESDASCVAPRHCVTSRLMDYHESCPRNLSTETQNDVSSTPNDTSDDASSKSNEPSCYCRMPNDTVCDSSEQCPQNERCVNFVRALNQSQRALCVSCLYCTTAVDVVPIDGGAGNCLFNRADPSSNSEEDNSPSHSASESPHQDSGDDGANGSGNDNGDGGEDNNSTGGEEEVCVDAQMLSHLHANDLVYSKHRRASVLCDRAGTCATRGHVVVFNHVPMMMVTYCGQFATCRHAIKLVNSPRMRRRNLRIPSRTNNLSLTAFAARYATRTEEMLLTTLIRLGA